MTSPNGKDLRALVARIVASRLADAVDPDASPGNSPHWKDQLQSVENDAATTQSGAPCAGVMTREVDTLYGQAVALPDAQARARLLHDYVQGP